MCAGCEAEATQQLGAGKPSLSYPHLCPGVRTGWWSRSEQTADMGMSTHSTAWGLGMRVEAGDAHANAFFLEVHLHPQALRAA